MLALFVQWADFLRADANAGGRRPPATGWATALYIALARAVAAQGAAVASAVSSAAPQVPSCFVAASALSLLRRPAALNKHLTQCWALRCSKCFSCCDLVRYLKQLSVNKTFTSSLSLILS